MQSQKCLPESWEQSIQSPVSLRWQGHGSVMKQRYSEASKKLIAFQAPLFKEFLKGYYCLLIDLS